MTALLTGLPECGFTLHHRDGSALVCDIRGDHFCEPRKLKVQAFFHELLCHTKGTYARKPFLLETWQANDIIHPLFGCTTWDEEGEDYGRQYRIAWIEIARKNGKSELLAGVLLYLLVADDEESAEVYGIARNREQAGLVYNVARRMVELSPVLSHRLVIRKAVKRIYDPRTDSFYQVLPADADSALGSNPHALGADEILAWPNGDMWTNTRTGMGSGARLQPLMIACTTAGRDLESFAGKMHSEMGRIADQPERSPHIFPYLRNLKPDADWLDERNWHAVNPAIASGFLKLKDMRQQALEAQNNPVLESAFKQFKLNMWQSSTIRWMNMGLFDNSCGVVHRDNEALFEAFEGRECWFGGDLAARQDLTSVCYLFPDPDDDEACDVIWRHYVCDSALKVLDERNGDQFTNEFVPGDWLTVTEGTVLDFERVYSDFEADSRRFTILGGDMDRYSSDPVIQRIEAITYIDGIMAYTNTFDRMADSMKRIFELTGLRKFHWHGNPLVRWLFDACEAEFSRVNPDLIKPAKPKRNTAAKRIDAVPAAIMAVNAWKGRGDDVDSVYQHDDVLVLG